MTTRGLTLGIANGSGRWWLIAGGVLYLTALLKIDDNVHLGISVLFVLALTALDSTRPEESGESASMGDRLSQAAGLWLVGLFLTGLVWIWSSIEVTSNVMNHPAAFAVTRLLPLVGVTGWSLWMAGQSIGRSYRRELLLAFFWSVPTLAAHFLVDISPLTARAAESNLRWWDFAVHRTDCTLSLGEASVRVYPGCSGIEGMGYLLGLSVICLMVFPTSRMHAWWLPLTAMLIAFWINAMRVAWLVVLAERRDRPSFDYWHIGQGSQWFGILSVTVLGLIYAVLLDRSRRGRDRAPRQQR